VALGLHRQFDRGAPRGRSVDIGDLAQQHRECRVVEHQGVANQRQDVLGVTDA
jgi:hypothetical protein